MIDHFTLDSSVAHQTIGQQLNWNMKNTFIKSCLFGTSVKGVILESGGCSFSRLCTHTVNMSIKILFFLLVITPRSFLYLVLLIIIIYTDF